MVCLNLKDKENVKLLDEYTRILGSEDAAYYLLAMNNGFPLDATPQGDTSDLYLTLLQQCNGDKKQAILNKALAYMPQFLEQNGDWTQGDLTSGTADRNGEPSSSMITGTCDNSDIQDILTDFKVKEVLSSFEKQNIPWRQIIIDSEVDDARQKFVDSYIADVITAEHNMSSMEIYGLKLNARKTWDENKQKEILGKAQERLAKVFNLKKVDLGDGRFMYKYSGNDPKQQLRVQFVNSLRVGDWTDDKGETHKGAFADQEAVGSAIGLIYIAMQEADATTLEHELAHRYIRMFWDSEVVQEALLAVDKRWKNFGQKGDAKTVEEELVNYIVESASGKWSKSQQLKALFAHWWNRFNDMIHEAIGRPLKNSHNDGQNMLDLIATYFTLNKDLSDSKADILYYEKYSGTVFQSDIDLKKAFYRIEEVLEAKLASEKAMPNPDNTQILNIQLQLSKLRTRDADFEQDVIETFTDFLNRASADINTVLVNLNSILSGGQAAIASLDVADFVHTKTDIINYYSNILRNYIDPAVRDNPAAVQQYNSGLQQFINTLYGVLNEAGRAYDTILKQYTKHVIDIYSDYLVDVGDKERFKANAWLWAQNQINNGECNPMEQFFGPAVSSTSPIVRLVEYITSEVNRDTFEKSLSKGQDLVKAYQDALNQQEHALGKKLSPKNIMKQFCELDDEGLPTGYFLQEYNEGQFKKNKNKELERLAKVHSIRIDPETKEFIFDTKQQYIDFYSDYYRWLSNEANLRYTADYYIQRLNYLSKPTIEAIDSLDHQIHLLLDKCTDKNSGIPIIADLSPLEKLQLQNLQEQKRQLSNPYVIELDSSGKVIHMEEKTGDAAIIADELSNWYQYLGENVQSKPDRVKYAAAEQYIINKYGQNSREHLEFKQQYEYQVVNPELYDLVSKTEVPDDVRKLKARKNKILSSVKKKGYYQPNLHLLNDEAWAELKKIDEKIAAYYKAHPAKPNVIRKGTQNYEDVFDTYDVLTISNGQAANYPYFSTLYNQYINTGRRVEFYDKFYYTNAKGQKVPLSVFSYQGPKEDVQATYGISPTTIMLESPFTELDVTSPWVNKDFDPKGKSIQLKDHYKSQKYYDMVNSTKPEDQAMYNVYKLLLDTMSEAYDMMPNLNKVDKMKLPQMRDRDAHLIFRNGLKTGLVAATFGFDTFGITERDTRYNEELTTRPDGTIVETIPQRWIQDLDDPTKVCTDVIGSVSMFYDMACNFANKSKVAPMFNALLMQLEGGIEGSQDKNYMHQAYRLKKYIQMYVYGRTRTGFKGGKMNKTERTISAITDKLAQKAHSKLMAHNWRSMVKNGWDSFSTLTQEIMAGKYFTVKDALWGNRLVGGEVFKALSSVGKTRNKSLLVGLMQYSGCSNSISEIFTRHNESWVRRVFGRFFNMGGYTLIDFTFKGWITAMAYHATRLVIDPNTGEKKFMTRDQARYAYHKAGLGMENGDKAWKNCERDSKGKRITLYNAYELDDEGKVRIKPAFRDLVRPKVSTAVGIENEAGERESRKIETRVSGIIRERAAIVNGVLGQTSGSAFSQNYIGALALQMRGWFLTQNFDNLKTGHDFAEYVEGFEKQTQGQEYARSAGPNAFRQSYRYYKNQKNKTTQQFKDEEAEKASEWKGQYNFETGTIENGQWRIWGAVKNFALYRNLANSWYWIKSQLTHEAYNKKQKRNFTANEVYAIRRLAAAHAMLLVTVLFTYIAAAFVTQYPKKWLSEFLYAVSVAATSERSAQIPVLNVFSVLDIVNSAFVSKSFIDDISKPIDLLIDGVQALKYEIFGMDSSGEQEYKQPVKGVSAFKDQPKWVRDFAKSMSIIKPEWGVETIWKNSSPYGNIASANYYYNNVSPSGTLSAKPDRKANASSSSGNRRSGRSGRKDSRRDSR